MNEPDLKPYKVDWYSEIEPAWSRTTKTAEFETQNDAENFILSLDISRNRKFVRANFKRG